jgi:Protein of unknown function (DUF2971)
MKARPSLDTAALNEFLESIGSLSPDLIFYPGDLQEIHHYTDLNGLRGILEAHDLWLTHSQYSNDDEELKHGFQIVERIIKARLAARPKPEPKEKEYLQLLAEMVAAPTVEGVYICCFCESGDLLSQWRSYGANGIGASIAFKPGDFSYIAGPGSPTSGLVRLWEVFYNQVTQESIVNDAINHHRLKPGLTAKERARQAADSIQFFIPTFKNQAFEEEKEIRLIFTPFPNCATKPRYRVARGMLVPYYSLVDLSGSRTSPSSPRLLPVTGVRIGPSANKRLNVVSAQMLVEQYGYGGFQVTSSDSPYRG